MDVDGHGPQYRRCLLMAGGGGRLGVHLGVHAAACEAGLAPDLLIGTCGGALTAALVQAEPDPGRQLAWLGSAGMLAVWQSVRPRAGTGLGRAGWQALRRALDPRPAPRVPALWREALFEAGQALPALPAAPGAGRPDLILVGARLGFGPGDQAGPRGGAPLATAVAWAPAGLLPTLRGVPAATGAPQHPGSAVAAHWQAQALTADDLQTAVRLSMTDMVYEAPGAAWGAHWLGGAVDLMPVELAARLAGEVIADLKDPVPRWTMGAAWRAALGVDGPARQRVSEAVPVAWRVDLRGLSRELPGSVLARRVRWARGRPVLALQACEDLGDYRRLLQAQFNAGRRRLRAALAAQR